MATALREPPRVSRPPFRVSRIVMGLFIIMSLFVATAIAMAIFLICWPHRPSLLQRVAHDPGTGASPALMVVAHPDDELIFGGEALLDTDSDWCVVVVTGATPSARWAIDRLHDRRFEEFKRCAETLGFEGRMWDHGDSPLPCAGGIDRELLRAQLVRMLGERNWRRVVSHNAEGEYGHTQHRVVHEEVLRSLAEARASSAQAILPDLEVFALDRAAPPCPERKRRLCRELYPSQRRVIDSLREWMIHGHVSGRP